MSRSLKGKKAIVTGAASGMGKETAKLLADEGVRVAILDLDEGNVKAVVDEINAVHPGHARGWVCDVADRSRIKEVCKEVIEDFGGLDVRGETPASEYLLYLTQTRHTDPHQQRRHLGRRRRVRQRCIIRDPLGQDCRYQPHRPRDLRPRLRARFIEERRSAHRQHCKYRTFRHGTRKRCLQVGGSPEAPTRTVKVLRSDRMPSSVAGLDMKKRLSF